MQFRRISGFRIKLHRLAPFRATRRQFHTHDWRSTARANIARCVSAYYYYLSHCCAPRVYSSRACGPAAAEHNNYYTIVVCCSEFLLFLVRNNDVILHVILLLREPRTAVLVQRLINVRYMYLLNNTIPGNRYNKLLIINICAQKIFKRENNTLIPI